MAYTGKDMDKRYIGESADITYSLKRCIHAEQCINHLDSVFRKNARPWIDAKGAPAQEIMAFVGLCPSGALHAEPKAGTAPEATPERNQILLWKDGPLQLRGNLS